MTTTNPLDRARLADAKRENELALKMLAEYTTMKRGLVAISNSTYPMGADGFKIWQRLAHIARAALPNDSEKHT